MISNLLLGQSVRRINGLIAAMQGGAIALAGLLLAGCSDIASSVAPEVLPHHNQTVDVSDVPPGTYKLDNSHAHFQFSVDHMGYSRLIGRFNSASGTIELDSAHPEQSPVTIVIDADSVDVIDDRLNEMLRGSDYFHVEKYPEIRFEAPGITVLDETTGELPGNLTIRGVTRPVTLDVTYNGGARNALTGDYVIGFSATARVLRSDFGMDDFVPMVGDETIIRIEAEFVRVDSSDKDA